MATLVLTVAGGAIGGPIGAAVGSLLGQAVDNAVLFRPGRREGPRLTELAVQTSSYGTAIPHIFGTMRVAGSVIWSTDLIEARGRSGGGKGVAATTTYSYSASFAVLLSARPVREVRRIWADGRLLRGAAGDFKSEVADFRLHRGDEAQAVDPLIAAVEGSAATPAYAGCAYVVFEQLQLADFGNRLPSLTFEVVAEALPLDVGTILAEVGEGQITPALTGETVTGYSAYGSTIRGLAEGLASAYGLWFVAEDGGLRPDAGTGAARLIRDAGAAVEGARAGAARRQRRIASAQTTPGTVTVAHYDAARDYQSSVQRIVRTGAARRVLRIDLPAVVTPGDARRLAGQALIRADREREQRRVTLDWRDIDIAPGSRVAIEGEPGVWRVTGWTLEAMTVVLELRRITGAGVIDAGSSGRVAPAPDLVHGPTVLAIAEAPLIDDALVERAQLLIAAAGTSSGWRGAAIATSPDGARWTPQGRTAPPSVIGSVATPLREGPATIEDRRNEIVVALLNAAMMLEDADDRALAAGANAALIGDELVQFGSAVPLGANRWRLSRLWRGRRGTEWAIGTHQPDERFVLLDRDALRSIDLSPALIGVDMQVEASGIGDRPDPSRATVRIDGRSLVPPAPVHGTWQRTPGDALMLSWRRRGRSGWTWIDGADVPLGEDAERYRVTLHRADGDVVVAEVSMPALAVDDPAVAAALASAEVRQLGTHGASRPLIISAQQ
ncbi:hypothetical protein GO308_11710 [Sphingomonas sp. SFZ2018-12]|uniref:phage tail protein n=1 Tax=Sphingomonas sp. SFZ2018-12 TaxID=2683197 RepID=UPI001F107430|nr:phage tail protein [Sphingomonas sp. SFZ2018-12]MCH4893778.1 hypothetical protein [Sphingomonas sp. SFZ2018-12]